MQNSYKKNSARTCTYDNKTIVHVPIEVFQDNEIALLNSRWRVRLVDPPDQRCQRRYVQLFPDKVVILVMKFLEILNFLPLIIETSLAPSPIANVTAFLARLISSTTSAFCNGVTRQHITALHCEAMSRNLKVKHTIEA